MNAKIDLSSKRLFLLDMDGTIYLDGVLFDGTLDLLRYVRSVGGRYIFLTNNSSRGTDAYVERLLQMGIVASPDDFVTSADATIRYLKSVYPAETLYYVCGTLSFKHMLRSAGLRVAETPSGDVNAVLLGYDTELTYRKLTDCCMLLSRGADYIATHPDMVCPVSYGYAPDCGSVIEMLFTATGRRPRIIGKPCPEMVYLSMERTGFTAEQTIVLGDRVCTDIACGVNAGVDTCLLLGGEGVPGDIEKYGVHPSCVFAGIRAFADQLLRESKK